MAIAFVQALMAAPATTTTTNNTFTITTTNAVSSGNTVLLAICYRDATAGNHQLVTNVSGGGVTWSVEATIGGPSAGGVGIARAYCPTGLPVNTNITITVGAGQARWAVHAFEYSGVANAAADKTATASANANPPACGPTGTLGFGGELIFMALAHYTNGSDTGTPDSGYTERMDQMVGSNTFLHAYCEDKIQGATTAASTGPTVSITSNYASAIATFAPSTPDTTAPTVPANLVATAQTASQISLSWDASTDNVAVTGYNIYRGGVKIAQVVSPGFNDSGLTASTLYNYKVSAVDAAGNESAQSTQASATTLASQGGTTPPVPPGLTTAYGTATAPLQADVAPGFQNQIEVRFTDTNGQTGSVTTLVRAITQTADVTGPTVAWSNGGSNANVDGANGISVLLSGTVSDPSGVKSLVVTQNAAQIYSTGSFPQGAFAFPATLVTGANAFVCTFTDASGNLNTTIVNFTLTLALAGVDVSPPTVGWQAPGGSITIAGSVGQSYTVRANVVDPSGIQSVTINGTAVTPDASGNVSLPVTLALGANVVTLVAVDNSAAHNSTGSLTQTITLVATLGPTLTVTTPTALQSTVSGGDGTLQVFEGTVTAASGVTQFTINGSPVPLDTNGNFSTFVILRTGQNTIEIVAVDGQLVAASTVLDYLVTLVDGPAQPVDIELSEDQIRTGARIHERGLE
jgi:chitodextrinase